MPRKLERWEAALKVYLLQSSKHHHARRHLAYPTIQQTLISWKPEWSTVSSDNYTDQINATNATERLRLIKKFVANDVYGRAVRSDRYRKLEFIDYLFEGFAPAIASLRSYMGYYLGTLSIYNFNKTAQVAAARYFPDRFIYMISHFVDAVQKEPHRLSGKHHLIANQALKTLVQHGSAQQKAELAEELILLKAAEKEHQRKYRS